MTTANGEPTPPETAAAQGGYPSTQASYPGQPGPQPAWRQPPPQPYGQPYPGQPGQQHVPPGYLPHPPGGPFGPALGAPPPRPSRRGRLLLVGGLLGLVFLLLCGGAGVLVITRWVGGGGGGGGATDLTLAWSMQTVQRKASEPNNAYLTMGSWLLDRSLVRAQHDGVTAFALTDGKEIWSVPVPEDTVVCTTSPNPDDGIVAIVYGPSDRCDQMAGIDLNSGEKKWQTKIPAEVLPRDIISDGLRGAVADARPHPRVFTAGGVAVVDAHRMSPGQKIAAYSISKGRQLWQVNSPSGCAIGDGANVDDKTLVYGETCLDRYAVVGIDLATGKRRWRTVVTEQQQARRVLSVSPTVIVKDDPDHSGDISVLDDAGKIVQSIPQIVDNVEFRRMGESTYDFPYLVDQDALYVNMDVKLERPDGQVVAFDLKTGKVKWKSTGSAWRPNMIRVDDQGILALEGRPQDNSVRLVRIDPASGKVSKVAQGPEAAADAFNTYTIHERNGVVAIVTARWTPLPSDMAVTVLLPK